MAIVAVDVFEDGVFDDNVFADYTSDYVDRLDLLNKIVFLKTSLTSVHPTDHIYPEVRGIRRVDESLRVMDMPVTAQGNEAAGDNFTPRRAVFNNGWRIGIENEVSGSLSITGEVISDDGLAGSQLVKLDYLSEGVSMLVNYTPPSSEVIVVSGGSGLNEAELHTALDNYTNKDSWKADNVTTDLTPVLNAISALNDISLLDIEGSTTLAKEATLSSIASAIAAIPTTDSVADLTPVLNAITALNDITPAEVRAAFNVAEFKDKNTEAEIHAWLDSYINKDNWKTSPADIVNALWYEVV